MARAPWRTAAAGHRRRAEAWPVIPEAVDRSDLRPRPRRLGRSRLQPRRPANRSPDLQSARAQIRSPVKVKRSGSAPAQSARGGASRLRPRRATRPRSRSQSRSRQVVAMSRGHTPVAGVAAPSPWRAGRLRSSGWPVRRPRRDWTRPTSRTRWQGASSRCSRRFRESRRSPYLSAPRPQDRGSRAGGGLGAMPRADDRQVGCR